MEKSGIGFTRIGLAAAALVLSAAGCSSSGPQSTVSIAMPDMKSLAVKTTTSGTTLQLTRLVINGTSSNSSVPQYLIWQAHSSGDTSFPTTWQAKWDRGGQALVQVLAVYGTANSDLSDQFYYGDAAISLSEDASPKISLSLLPQNVGAYTGLLSGRYLSVTGDGPTGIVDMKFTPMAGKPAMIVSQTEMHGGWFEFTAFQNANFTYTLEGYGDIATNFNLDNTTLLGTGKNMVVTVPGASRSPSNGGGATDPMKLVLGYFGPGSTALTTDICYDPLSTDPDTSLVDANGTAIAWSGTNAPNSAQAGVVTGGLPNTDLRCNSPAAAYTNYLSFNQTNLQSTRGNLGFYGPFEQVSTSGNNYATLTHTAAAATVQLSLLPGTVGPLRITHFGVFARDLATVSSSNGSADYQQDDLISCNSLTTLATPFALTQKIPVGAAGATTLNLTTFNGADYDAGKYQVILCPYSTALGAYFGSALALTSNSSSSSSSSTPNYKVTATNANVAASVCGTYQISLVDGGGNALTTSSAQSFTLSTSLTSGTYNIYSDTNCSSPDQITASPILSIPAGQSSVTFTMRVTNPGLFTLSATNSVGWGRSLTAASVGSGTATTVVKSIIGASTYTSLPAVTAGLCYPIDLYLQDATGSVAAGGGITFVPSAAAVGGSPASATFYSDASCGSANALSSVSFGTAIGYHRIWMLPASSGDLMISGSTTGGGTSLSSSGSEVYVASSAPTTYQLIAMDGTASTSFYSGSTNSSKCLPVAVTALDGEGLQTSASITGQAVIAATVAGSGFYSSATCTGSSSSSLSLALSPSTNPSSLTSQVVYMLLPAGAISTAYSITFNGVSLAGNFARIPDQFTLKPSYVIGTPSSTVNASLSACVPYTLSALWSGATAAAPAVMSIDYSSYGNIGLYSDAACTSSILTQAGTGFSKGSTTSEIVYARSSAAGTSVTLWVDGFSSLPTTITPTYSSLQLVPSFSANTFSANQCVQLSAAAINSGAAASTGTFTVVSGTGLRQIAGGYFYNDSNCSTAAQTNSLVTAVTATSFSYSISSSTASQSTGTLAPYVKVSATPAPFGFQVTDSTYGTVSALSTYACGTNQYCGLAH